MSGYTPNLFNALQSKLMQSSLTDFTTLSRSSELFGTVLPTGNASAEEDFSFAIVCGSNDAPYSQLTLVGDEGTLPEYVERCR